MNRTIKMALVAGLGLAGLGFAAETASAAPMTGLDNAVAHQSDLQKGVQNVRYFCGPWGCRWAPGPIPIGAMATAMAITVPIGIPGGGDGGAAGDPLTLA